MSDVTRRLLPVAAAAAVLALLAAPVSAQTAQRGLPSRTLLDRFGLERAWTNQATIDVRSDVVRHLVADEEVVIVQARSGLITVFDAQSGVKLWDGQLARADRYSYPATTNSRSLFIVIGSTVYARDKFRGGELWTLRLPSVPSTSPTVDDDRMYVGTLDGSVYAYDLNRVAKLQAESRLGQYVHQTVIWKYKTSSEIVTAPVTDGKVVAFANMAGSLIAVSPTTRKLAFQLEVNQPASAPLELVDDAKGAGILYFAAGNTNFYSLRAANGTTRWLYVAGAPIREKPHAIGESVLLVPVHAGLYNLDQENGRVLWWEPTIEQFVAASPTRIFGTDREGNLAVIGRADGAVLGTIPALGFPIRISNDRTDRIFMASESGIVTCLREHGAELPIYHRFPERRPILPLFGGENGDDSGTTPAERAEEAKAAEAVPETAPETPAPPRAGE
jgi:outer membrane protein assembly factor BamB